MKKFILILALILLTMPSALQAASPQAVGQKIPHDLSTLDQNGVSQSFDALKGESGLVVLFVRSVDWCPYCQGQIIGINDNLQEFTNAGYKVVTISYDQPETLKIFSDKRDVKFTLLSDPQSKIIKSFSILDPDQKAGTRFYGIPHPTIYVINPHGVITAILSEEGYKNRPELQDILDAL
jgi:peroxiredoxin